ncbi:hypothetical protein CP8484711_0647, partial [Chlamydia psittaci 84-8471/1]
GMVLVKQNAGIIRQV